MHEKPYVVKGMHTQELPLGKPPTRLCRATTPLRTVYGTLSSKFERSRFVRAVCIWYCCTASRTAYLVRSSSQCDALPGRTCIRGTACLTHCSISGGNWPLSTCFAANLVCGSFPRRIVRCTVFVLPPMNHVGGRPTEYHIVDGIIRTDCY